MHRKVEFKVKTFLLLLQPCQVILNTLTFSFYSARTSRKIMFGAVIDFLTGQETYTVKK